MKKIFIMRHGEATAMQADDAARPLTEQGRIQVRTMAKKLKLTSSEKGLLVSPYTRTKQTAELLTQEHRFDFFETFDGLIPSGDPESAIDYVQALISLHPKIDTWFIIAHMPIVSYLVDQLSPGDIPIFNTAAVALVEYEEDTNRGQFKTMFHALL